MTFTNITPKQLRRAAGLQEKINKLQADLGRLLGGSGSGDSGAGRSRRRMSAAARKKIGEAQKKRWAKYHAARGK